MPSKIEKTNTGYIRKYGGDNAKHVSSFSRIRTFNSKNSAITHDGDTVERADSLFIDGYGLVKCMEYELHFIYIDPHSLDTDKRIKGRWGIMCTCGSMGGVISYNEVKGLMTIDGLKGFTLGCLMHTQTKQDNNWGVHADGSHE